MTVDVRIRMIAMKRIVTENDIVGNCSSCGNDYIWLTERGLRISNDRLAKEVINHFEYGALVLRALLTRQTLDSAVKVAVLLCDIVLLFCKLTLCKPLFKLYEVEKLI